ncbi:putative transmembrane and coiled-coil domain-containing protein 6 [Scophthalmus maximus]|uniref:Putative transmembrane and coiled-coil domain-containing protein 6 n=1 Tax=Scophthalmus maximus TaxID=52904 RepID=A0A2U9C6E8_SCOMX|nr:putative transmembrane and coiled-coil domain-containing protein 6 [Scophthalmus maximus]
MADQTQKKKKNKSPMWRLNRVRLKAGRLGDGLAELRLKRREHEKGLLATSNVTGGRGS